MYLCPRAAWLVSDGTVTTTKEQDRVTYGIETEPIQPVVGALDRVEDGGIVTVQHHAHGRNHGDVPERM